MSGGVSINNVVPKRKVSQVISCSKRLVVKQILEGALPSLPSSTPCNQPAPVSDGTLTLRGGSFVTPTPLPFACREDALTALGTHTDRGLFYNPSDVALCRLRRRDDGMGKIRSTAEALTQLYVESPCMSKV